MLQLLLLGGLATAALLLTRRPAGERQKSPAGFAERSGEDRRAASTTAIRRLSTPTLKKREQEARELAEELLFKLERRGRRYCLFRDSDVPKPVRRENLTIQEVEETLSNWKLRGFHGG